jgi:hypothetical protein
MEPQPTAEVSTPQQTVPAEQTDLSGTYSGTFTCDEAGLTGDTTLTITGNQFTTSDGRSGRIVATTTRGYTAVAFQPEVPAGQSSVISLRGKKSGSRLTLTPTEGSSVKCSFVPSRISASRRKAPAPAPAAAATTPEPTATTVTNPAEAGPSPADVAKPAPARAKSKRTKSAPAVPAAAPAAPPSQMPMPQPAPAERPVPKQTPSPNPSPSPEASPSPSASPSPEASPTPSPTPSPKPPVRS